MVQLSDHILVVFVGIFNLGMVCEGVSMKIHRILGLTVFAIVASICVYAQTTNGRVLGTVHDPSGAALANATVTVTDTQRGVSRTLTTDESGNFVAPSLTPGIYTVRAAAKGFKTVERQNVQVEVARDVSLDFTLPTGEVKQEVVVSSDVPMLNTTSATLGGTLSNKEINDLPLNGRNYENLLQLRPGVMRYPGGGFSTTSANGLRAEDNVYLVEGLYNSEPFPDKALSTAPESPATRQRSCLLTQFKNLTSSRTHPRNTVGSRVPSSMLDSSPALTICTERPMLLAAIRRSTPATTSTPSLQVPRTLTHSNNMAEHWAARS